MPPVDPLNGCLSLSPLPGDVSAQSGRRWPIGLIFGIPSWLMPLSDRSGQRWPPSGMPYVVAATEVCSRFIGICWGLIVFQAIRTFPPAMFPSPAGLAPVEGIPMRGQAILHREIFHVHALLDLTTSLLRTRLAILSPLFLVGVTSPHLQVQIRGLDSAIQQATQAIHILHPRAADHLWLDPRSEF